VQTQTVAQLKAQGNKAFSNNDFGAALELYSKALKIEENNVLYSNRSACRVAMAKFSEALQDAERCLQLDPNWPKVRCAQRVWRREY
jgi:stress-induced-phosphoprotein 1